MKQQVAAVIAVEIVRRREFVCVLENRYWETRVDGLRRDLNDAIGDDSRGGINRLGGFPERVVHSIGGRLEIERSVDVGQILRRGRTSAGIDVGHASNRAGCVAARRP